MAKIKIDESNRLSSRKWEEEEQTYSPRVMPEIKLKLSSLYSDLSLSDLQNKRQEIVRQSNEYAAGSSNRTKQFFNLATWTGQTGKKLKDDEQYQNMQKDIADLDSLIEERMLAKKQESTEKLLASYSGGVMRGIRGITSSINKINPLKDKEAISLDTQPTYIEKKGQAAIEQANNSVTKAGLEIASSIGQMTPQLLSPVKTVNFITGFANYGGSAYNEAKNEGKTEAQATVYGLAIGALEMGMQRALGGLSNVYGKSKLSSTTDKIMKNILKNDKVREILSEASSEFVEEYLQDIVNPIVRNVVFDENNKVKLFTTEALYSGILGALTSGIMEIPAIATGSTQRQQEIQTNTDYDTQQTTVENTLKELNNDTSSIMQDTELTNDAKLEIINTQIDMLNDTLTTDVKVGTLDIEALYNQKQDLIKQREEIAKQLTEEEKTEAIKSLSTQITEIFNADTENITPAIMEVVDDKVQQVEKMTKEVEKDKKIKVLSNKQKIQLNSEQYINEAADIINNINMNIPEGQKRVEIVTELNQEQRQIMDLGAVFGKQIIFTDNMPYSGLVSQNNPNILFIDNKATSQLVTNKQATSLYVLGHELFHSLKQVNPETYNQFTDYVKQNVTVEQIVDFAQKYDPQNANELLNSIKIDGEFKLDEIKKHYLKYKNQNAALDYIIEEMTANEFGGMITDSNYMNKLYESNKSLFDKVVDAIRELFKSLTGSAYDSSLTQLQVEKIRNDFENVVSEIGQKNEIKQTASELNYVQIDKTKQFVHTTNALSDILNSNNIKGTEFSVAVQKQGQRLNNYGEQAIFFKPEILQYVDENTMYKGDGGNNRAGTIRENQEKFSSVNELLENNPKYYNEIKFKENIPLSTIKNVIIPSNSSDALINKLKENNIEYKLRPVRDTYNSAVKTTEQPAEIKQEVKKPVEVKEEVKPGTQGTKTTQMDMGVWFDNINKMYDKYVETKDKDRLTAVTNAYENYKKKGGTEVISELDSVVETKAKTDFKSKLKEAGLDFKSLPKNSIDSKGRQLTDSQTVFFNNSEARDTNGNLLVMYHYTDGQFDTFDKLMQGTNTRASNTKLGFFFSPNEEFTKRFGKNKKEVYLNLENPLHFPTKDSSDSQVIEYLKITEQENKIKRLENQVERLNKENENDIPYTMGSVFDFAINYYDEPGTIKFKRNMKDLRNYAEKAGYDSIIMPNEYVAFNANQIKYVDNKNPGSSNDMRYLPKEVTDTAGQQKESQFYANTAVNSPVFKSIIDSLSKNEGFRYYSTVSHKTDFNKAIERIQQRGDAAITDFMATKSFDSVDSAMAKILMEYYQRNGDVQSETNVAIKVREAITQGAQVVESAKIFKNMSPASMLLQVETDLNRAYESLQDSGDPIVRAWLNENANGITFTNAEKDWLYQNFAKLQKLDANSREYAVKHAVIQSFVANKIPKNIANKVKAFRRIAMLFNPKTMGRNILGNVVVVPAHRSSDRFGSYLDSFLAKQTGVRTTGNRNVQAYKEGRARGLQYAKQDFELGINTDASNAFEKQVGKTWKDSDLRGAGKVLNYMEKWMNYGLDIGDRPFYEAYYENSLANQMRLNNVTEPTQSMIEIAQAEAAKKTWKNNGKMVHLASTVRRIGNMVGFKNGKLAYDSQGNVDLGVGDIILPFIMTPANLAVAVYDYSPAAFASVYKNARAFNSAVKSGKNVDVTQKALVDSFGRASTGVVLFAIAYALAKAGLISGGEDEDKDVRALMKAQGYQPYSIKIGDTTFSYDWAQPIANPFAIMAELNRQTEMNKNNPNKSDEANNMFKTVSEAFTLGADRLYEQSFLQSLKNIFSAETPQEAVINFTGDLPASFVPTLFKQIADTIDGNAKATYDKNNLLTSMFARAAVKIPVLKSTLPTKKDVLGNNIELFGGENNIFNTMFNPANVSKDKAGDVGKELSDVYNHTGEKAIMPQVAVKYIDYDTNGDGIKERITFDNKQQSTLQGIMGKLSADTVYEMLNNSVYQNASYDDKATALTSLVQYAKAVALRDSGLVPNYEIKSGNAAQIDNYTNQGLSIPDAVMYDSLINPIKSLKNNSGETIQGSENGQKAYTIMNMQISDNSKNTMLKLISPTSKNPETVSSLSKLSTVQQYIDYYSLSRTDYTIINKYSRDDYDISTQYFNIDGATYTKFANEVSEIRADVDANGNVIANSKKNKVFEYINSLPLNQYQKLYLFSVSGYSIKSYSNQMFSYINSLDISADEKRQIWTSLGLK